MTTDTDADNSEELATDEHTRDLLQIAEGDVVTLVTHDGDEIAVTCTKRTTENIETVHIMEDTQLWFERTRDGEPLTAKIIDGVRGTQSAPKFPWHIPLTVYDESRTPRDDAESIGYVKSVRS